MARYRFRRAEAEAFEWAEGSEHPSVRGEGGETFVLNWKGRQPIRPGDFLVRHEDQDHFEVMPAPAFHAVYEEA